MKKLLNIRIGFALFMLVVFAYGAYGVKDMVLGARIFPISVAAPGVLLVLIQLYREIRRSLNPEPEGTSAVEERVIDVASDTTTSASVVYARGMQYLSWLLGLYVGIYTIGFKISIPIYIVLFMRLEGKAPWKVIVAGDNHIRWVQDYRPGQKEILGEDVVVLIGRTLGLT